MNKVMKIVTIFAFIVTVLFTAKIDTHAEVVWNTTGELSPYGTKYTYKYWQGDQWIYTTSGAPTIPQLIDVTYEVTYCYEEAYKINALVNEQRRKAGVPEVEMKDELMDVAMQRAAETALYWEHIRPSGLGSGTVSMFVDGENIHYGSRSAKDANANWVESEGHYKNMIGKRWAYAGYGCVEVNNSYYWVQIFSVPTKYYEDGYDAEYHYENDYYVDGVKVVVPSSNDNPVLWDEMTVGNRKDYKAKFTTKLNPELRSEGQNLVTVVTDKVNELYVGEKEIVRFLWCVKDHDNTVTNRHVISADQYDVVIKNPSICSYDKGIIMGLKCGTTKITFTLKADRNVSSMRTISVKKNSFRVNGNTYKITDFDDCKVELIKASTKKNITIPRYVKLDGMDALNEYKVTSIAANAFKNNKKVTSVTLGKNVTNIGKNAFRNCKNLKRITIKSSKLKMVGKNALKGIHKNAVIKVPKSKLKKYKTLFKGKGQKKTVKIKK